MTRPKLLLADDSATIRKVVELTFVDEGIDVFAVGDGEAAMLKFVEVQPDIVLVDVEMPGPTGYQICDMIKQDASTQHIPVLLLVGSFEPFDQDEAERVGADGFLTKPFHSIRELVARVSELLGASHGIADDVTLADEVPMAAGPEIDDIEQLYHKSFADTMPMHDLETEEDLLREAGMGETGFEMVPAGDEYQDIDDDPFGHGVFVEAEREPADETEGSLQTQETMAEQPHSVESNTKTDVEVDVEKVASPEVEHLENPAVTAITEVEPIEMAEAAKKADPFDDVSLDDEMILAVKPGGDLKEPEEPQHSMEIEVSESQPEAEAAPETEVEIEEPETGSNAVTIKDFDWSPSAKVADDPFAEPATEPVDQHTTDAFEPRFSFADAETIEGNYAPAEPEKLATPPQIESLPEPTEELIARIAQRVVERLSDRVIREIAGEAVPRITEKLIREALDEENKT